MADYTYKPSINIDGLVSGLKNLKAEAVSAEKVMAMIGNRGNLNKLLETFLRMDNLVNNLTRDSDKLRESFGKQLRGGYLDNLDKEFGNLSKLINDTRGLSENILNVDLRKSNASAQIRDIATQINTMMAGLGLASKIDFDIFDAKSLGEQRDELIGYINQIGSQITLSIGKIDSSQIASIGDKVAEGLDDATKNIKNRGKKLNNEIRKQLKELHDLIQERDSWEDVGNKEEYEKIDKKVQDRKQKFIKDFSLQSQNQKVLMELEDLGDDDETTNKIIKHFQNIVNGLGSATSNVGTEVGGAFKTITSEIDDASNSAQKLMYHLGNLLGGAGKSHNTFGDMAEDLTFAVKDTKWEKYGYGVLGGGLFGVTDPSKMTQSVGKTNFIQSIDISKYNMYMADTEERAMSLMDFLSKLQKFSMKLAEPNYTGFDSMLKDVSVDSLYGQFKVLFDQSELTKEQFTSFITEMCTMLSQAGLAFDSQTGELNFNNISDELAASENISTRFMKMLGFEGVNVGTTSLDGFEQGSVLFDFKQSDIVGYFNDAGAAIRDYQNILNQVDGQEWVGSNEQLKEYANNIDIIISRLQAAKEKHKFLDTEETNTTLDRLYAIKENINNILSGKGSNKDSEFKSITTEVDNASNKVEEFKKLCGDISSALMRDDMSNFDIGINTEKLETAKKELDALGEQGKITADELEQINDVFNRAKTELGEIKTRNEDRGYDKEGYGDGYGSRSYDYSFEDEYRDAEERAISAEAALRLKQEENAELRKQISDKKKKLYETPSGQMSLFENMAEDAQKANDSASKLENTVKNIENLDGQISLFDKPDLYENADGELSLWENADAGAKKTEESINGVRDAIKEVKNLDGQINLFEQMDAERAANEVQQLEAHLQSLGNEFQQSQQFSNIWTNLSNEVKSGAKTAEQAIKELDSAFSKFDAEKNMSRIEQTTKAQKDKVNKLFKSLDFDLTTPDLTYGQKSIADKYQDVITQINALKKNSAKATSAQVNDINTVIAALEKEINAYKVQNNLTDQATKKATKGMANYGARDVEKAQGRYDLLSQSANSYVQNGSVPIGNALNKYTTALNNLIAAQKKFSAIQDSTSAEASQARTEFDKLKIQYNDCARALSNLIKQSESFQGKNKKIEKLNGAYDLESEAGRGDALKDYIQNVYGADAAIGQFNDSVTELNFTLKNADGTVSQMSASFDESMSMIGSSTQKVEKSTNMFSSMFGEIKKKGKELLQYTAARIGIDEVIQQVRNGIQYVREIDTALTELKKVTNETDATYNQFLQTASKTAGVIGSTVSELTTMSAEWARLGYSIEESAKLAESTAILLNVSEFTDATQASEALISTMQAFQYTADDSQHVVDVLNEVGKFCQ